MKLIPSHVWDGSSEKKGEPQVFQLLEKINLSSACVALHSQNLHGGRHQAWHEMDFLVISERAIIGIEVKAGRVACIDGWWYVYRKDGSVSYKKPKSPLVQISDALEHFRTGWLKDTFGKRFSSVPFVKVAILCSNPRPDKRVNPMGPELTDEMTIYSEDLSPEKFKDRLNVAIDYHLSHGHPGRARILTDEEIDEISMSLRPRLDLSYPSAAAGQALRDQQNELTEEQYYLADAIQNVERYIVDGGAGTGKTFLMVYDALRKQASGDRVAILAPTEPLQQHISVSTDGKIDCFTRAQIPDDRAYDAIYVDEAQDFINQIDFQLMDGLINGGMAEGCWRLYGDFENQLSPDSKVDKGVWEFLVDCTGNGAVLPLTRNVRNTPEIVNWLEKVCGARIGRTSTLGSGPDVEVIAEEVFWDYVNGKQYHAVYGAISWDELTVLYPQGTSPQFKERICSQFSSRCAISTIEGFRGLEANIIYLCGVDQIEDKRRLRDQLYKGVSRARNLCLISGGDSVLQEMLELMRLGDGE